MHSDPAAQKEKLQYLIEKSEPLINIWVAEIIGNLHLINTIELLFPFSIQTIMISVKGSDECCRFMYI